MRLIITLYAVGIISAIVSAVCFTILVWDHLER